MVKSRKIREAFSLIEILIVVAVVGVLSALVLSYISGTSEYANQAVARQQQAQLQTALDNWLTAAASTSGGLAAARATYNSQTDKLQLLSDYLQADSLARFTAAGNVVSSAALTASKASLEFSETWNADDRPTVTWKNSP